MHTIPAAVAGMSATRCGRCGRVTLTGMNRLQDRLQERAAPRVRVTLRSSQRATEVRIRITWCCRLSGPAAARLLAVAALVIAATVIVTSAHDELARGVLYSLAGFLTAARQKIRS
jgi:hypothetical protein